MSEPEGQPEAKRPRFTIPKGDLEKPHQPAEMKAWDPSFWGLLQAYDYPTDNPEDDIFTILLSRDRDERRLYEVLVMKKMLEMNPDLELTLKYFKPGIEILFPSPEVLLKNSHVVDRDAAKIFYEVNDYYGSFEQDFNRATADLGRLIKAQN